MKKIGAPRPLVIMLLFSGFVNLAVVVCLLSWTFSHPSGKIVYVDVPKLMLGYKGMTEARKEYDQKVSVWNKNLDSLAAEVQGKINEYNDKKNKLSRTESQLLEELIDSKRNQYSNYREAIEERVKLEDQNLTSQVVSEINEFIKKYAEQRDYEYVLTANQFGTIAYAQTGTEITGDILKGLNEQFERRSK